MDADNKKHKNYLCKNKSRIRRMIHSCICACIHNCALAINALKCPSSF